MLSARSSGSSPVPSLFSRPQPPLSDEERASTERLVNDAELAADEASAVANRLRKATRLYRERLTGKVEEPKRRRK